MKKITINVTKGRDIKAQILEGLRAEIDKERERKATIEKGFLQLTVVNAVDPSNHTNVEITKREEIKVRALFSTKGGTGFMIFWQMSDLDTGEIISTKEGEFPLAGEKTATDEILFGAHIGSKSTNYKIICTVTVLEEGYPIAIFPLESQINVKVLEAPIEEESSEEEPISKASISRLEVTPGEKEYHGMEQIVKVEPNSRITITAVVDYPNEIDAYGWALPNGEHKITKERWIELDAAPELFPEDTNQLVCNALEEKEGQYYALARNEITILLKKAKQVREPILKSMLITDENNEAKEEFVSGEKIKVTIVIEDPDKTVGLYRWVVFDPENESLLFDGFNLSKPLITLETTRPTILFDTNNISIPRIGIQCAVFDKDANIIGRGLPQVITKAVKIHEEIKKVIPLKYKDKTVNFKLTENIGVNQRLMVIVQRLIEDGTMESVILEHPELEEIEVVLEE